MATTNPTYKKTYTEIHIIWFALEFAPQVQLHLCVFKSSLELERGESRDEK